MSDEPDEDQTREILAMENPFNDGLCVWCGIRESKPHYTDCWWAVVRIREGLS